MPNPGVARPAVAYPWLISAAATRLVEQRNPTAELTGPRRYRAAYPDRVWCEKRFLWIRSNDLLGGGVTQRLAAKSLGFLFSEGLPF